MLIVDSIVDINVVADIDDNIDIHVTAISQ